MTEQRESDPKDVARRLEKARRIDVARSSGGAANRAPGETVPYRHSWKVGNRQATIGEQQLRGCPDLDTFAPAVALEPHRTWAAILHPARSFPDRAARGHGHTWPTSAVVGKFRVKLAGAVAALRLD